MSTDEVKAKIEKLRETVARLEFKPTPPIVREHGELHIAIPKATPPPKDKGAIRYEMPVKKSIAPLPIRELDNVPLHTIPKKIHAHSQAYRIQERIGRISRPVACAGCWQL